jgi:murein DD-endopeptidase MepM/ murein hydrolase activator NlpD
VSRIRLILLTTVVILALGTLSVRLWRAESRKPSGTTAATYIPSLDLIRAADLARLPVALRFDSPVGSEHGALAYNAQHFGEWNQDFGACHLGDDLNGIGGYNTDLGDPAFCVADGRVLFAGNGGQGWGNLVIVAHAVEEAGGRNTVQSLYAHLDTISVAVGQNVVRGEKIGGIGTAGGRYYAHLHFEIREFPTPHIGAGYRHRFIGWRDPARFLAAHRGAPDDDLRIEAAVHPE